MKLEQLRANAEAVSKYLGIRDHNGIGGDDGVIWCGDKGYVEHTIHELAHAVLMGIKLNERKAFGVTSEIAHRLHVVQHLGQHIPIANERRTWSVEWLVLRHFKVFEEVAWADITAAAEVQGVDWPGMQRMEKETEAAWAKRHAQTIIRILEEGRC